jgi:hypothetical protein
MTQAYEPRGVMITLSDDELEQAKRVGDGRNAANTGSPDKPYYHRELMQDDETASFAAACAEAAVAKATGRQWHAKVWPAGEHWKHRDEPDVGRNIEVRRIREPNNGLVVREKDLNKGKVIFVAYPLPETRFRQVDVIGWLRAEDAWDLGKEAFEETRRVPQSLVNKLEAE